MSLKVYRNIGGKVEECGLFEGAEVFTPDSVLVPFEEPGGRRVARTDLPNGIVVSTVFLVFDYGYGGLPLLFETMAFDRDGEELTTVRYSTVEEAREGHREVVRQFRPRSKEELASGG